MDAADWGEASTREEAPRPGMSAYPGMQAINAFLIRERADIGEAAEEALEVGAIPIF